ncbi:MAG: cation:proton antiporter [Polyangiaceae bacterium]
MNEGFSPQVAYIGVLFGLFVVPRVLQRFRIPAAITSLCLGAAAGPGLGLFAGDAVIALLSTLGIVSLFLFAGLEVNVAELLRERRILTEHIAVRLAVLALGAWVVAKAFPLDARPAVLFALAVLTPSTGFILDSLSILGLPEATNFWVRSKAIATELVALTALFFTLQSASTGELALSTAALVLLVALLPVAFRAFARHVVPYAPNSEFAFLLMVSVVCAFATKKLGVYYLVGAFVVGMVAQRLREELPAMASERMLDAIESFASIFVPFYFFHAGLALRRSAFSFGALLTGCLLLLLAVPLRLVLVAAHRKLRLGESFRESLRVGIPMTPTLVFTLVVAEILGERFAAPSHVTGGLVIYALGNTVIPSVVLRSPPPEFETPEVPAMRSNPRISSSDRSR